MKTFYHAVFIWFLFQFVLIAAHKGNSGFYVHNHARAPWCDEKVSVEFYVTLSTILPLTAFLDAETACEMPRSGPIASRRPL